MPNSLRYCLVHHLTKINRALSVLKVVAVAGLFVTSSSLSQAQQNTDHRTIYKSIGKFGEVKYSQFAPETNTKAEIIQMRSDGRPSQPGLFAPATTDPNGVNLNLANNIATNNYPNSNIATNHTTTISKPSDPNTTTPSQCQKLKNNLSNLQAGGEIYEAKAEGVRRYLDPAQVAVKIERTQQLLAQYCN
ncbi:hypothetical protein [Psychrobacter phenylpyruvicus]|uniref:DUF4124 domain-containing protein n=1 Tax=Psychrobacter phenylpyruvicus TaxID=29432 RepID=A0A379LN90_9GAMM|nr:hypothetical protein [Psychrobacter phenylpyruvicus]SUD91565.1 Uncharacterised protein [Psychrobacter phenylpyruvicus]